MTAFQAGLIVMKVAQHEKAADLSGVDVLVLVTLFSFTREGAKPSAFPSAAKIAERSLLARRTVQRSLDRLEEAAIIAGEHHHRRVTRWELDPFFIKDSGVTESPSGVAQSSAWRQRVQQLASERRSAGDRVAHQCTEGRFGPKVPNRTDVEVGSASQDGSSASLATASSTPPGGIPVGMPVGLWTGDNDMEATP